MEQSLAVIDGANRFTSGTAVSVGLQTEEFTADYWGLREGSLTVSGDHTLDEYRRLLTLAAAEKSTCRDRSRTGWTSKSSTEDSASCKTVKKLSAVSPSNVRDQAGNPQRST